MNIITIIFFGFLFVLILVVDKNNVSSLKSLQKKQNELIDKINTLSKEIEELKEKINKPIINRIGYK